MTIAYDEIMLKFVEGRLVKMYDWLLKNLETDPEVVAGVDKDKEDLRRFLQEQVDVLEDFIQAGGIDERDSQDDADIFGAEDIVTSPNSTLDEKSQDFMHPDEENRPDWLDDSAGGLMPGWDDEDED